jgi:calcium channel MID1
VPGNPNNFPNFTSLAAFYDNATQAQYQFFQNGLAQTPCETTSSAQYSLEKTCDDCITAYKEWLCSVMMPRCTDFSSTLPWLQERAMGQPFPNGTMLDPALVTFANQSLFLNGSRNPQIDTEVVPGPYKEILPCNDLCYNIVRSCPSTLGFACPLPGRIGYNHSYGQKPQGSQALNGKITDLTCNYPGAAYYLSAGGRMMPLHLVTFVTLVIMSIIFV